MKQNEIKETTIMKNEKGNFFFSLQTFSNHFHTYRAHLLCVHEHMCLSPNKLSTPAVY